MPLLQTARLTLSEFTQKDAPLMLALLNDPDFVRNVGDRDVHSIDDAARYIASGPMAMYRRHNLGLLKVELADGTAIGTCGLVRRDGLDDVDIGFAFLPAFRNRGYALEAARAVMEYGRDTICLQRIVAIARPDNTPSIRLLEKMGLKREGLVTLPGDSEELLLLAWQQ